MRLRGSNTRTVPKPSRASRMPPTLAFDPGGHRIIHVPLTKGRIATLDAADFKSLEAQGVPLTWFLNEDGKGTGYVRVRLPAPAATLTMVARLILRVPLDHIIRYVDGDPLNLRRSNLVAGKRASPELEQRVQAALAAVAERQERTDADWFAANGGRLVSEQGAGGARDHN